MTVIYTVCYFVHLHYLEKFCQRCSLVYTIQRGVMAMQSCGVGDVSLSCRMFVLDGGVYDWREILMEFNLD